MSHTSTLRRFNRTYTQRIGVLDDSFLGLGLPLGAARLLFEIGPNGTTTHALRERLDLDSGYLSRLLRLLESRGLVGTEADVGDRRRRSVRLSEQGRAAYAQLEERSEELAQKLLEPLTERQRTRLTEALATADLLVQAATVHLRVTDQEAPEAVEAVGRYLAEIDERFPDGFDPGRPKPIDVFVVATSDGRPVACGGVQDLETDTETETDTDTDTRVGEVKRMWVDPAWRGAGLGARLLRHLEDLARDRGHAVVRLDTNGALTEAIALYERAGYHRIERYNDNPYAELFFEKSLTPPG